MIIDDVLARGADYWMPKPYFKYLYEARVRSYPHRFEFSEEASELAGRLAIDAGALVIGHRQFAIPPYNCMYVEIDSRAFFKTAKKNVDKADTEDDRLGFLFDGSKLIIFSKKDDYCNPSPYYYHLMPPGEDAGPDGAMSIRQCTPDSKLVILLGSAAATVAAHRNKDDILRACSIHITANTMLLSMVNTSAFWLSILGDVRNAWSILLWLNQPSRINYTNQPTSRRISHGRPITYAKHRVVNIELGKFKTIARAYLAGAPRESPRRHEVRGAFHHHGGLTIGCSHVWPMRPDDNGAWICLGCGRKRWWMRAHVRGDATKGFVTHEYEVTPVVDS